MFRIRISGEEVREMGGEYDDLIEHFDPVCRCERCGCKGSWVIEGDELIGLCWTHLKEAYPSCAIVEIDRDGKVVM